MSTDHRFFIEAGDLQVLQTEKVARMEEVGGGRGRSLPG
jgi:hypothetical protein